IRGRNVTGVQTCAIPIYLEADEDPDLVPVDMLTGEEVGVMDLGALGQGEDQVGILICFEIAYDSLVQDVVDGGAEVIVVQSNNEIGRACCRERVETDGGG